MAGLRFARPLLLVATLALFGASPASAGSAYVNPFPSADYSVGRTDMGVDVCLTAGDPIVAVGPGLVVGIQRDWFEKQPYVWYELTSGPYAGRFVYVAEQITPRAKVGQQLSAGETIATYAKKGTCIETGWSADDGATLAQSTTGYHEGDVTTAGISFAHFLISLGIQGQFELTAPKAQAASKKNKKVKKTTTKSTTTTTTTSKTTTTTKTTTSKAATTRPSPNQSGGSSSQPPGASGGTGWPGGGGSSGATGSPGGGGGSSGGSSWLGDNGSGGSGWS